MSILRDLIEKKAIDITVAKIKREREQAEKESIVANHDVTYYNKSWLQSIANKYDYSLTDNEFKINQILKRLNERNGHCPCGGMTDDFLCPCKMMREHGACKCGLYQHFVDLNPRETKTTGRIKPRV